jgi:hypothetical protein
MNESSANERVEGAPATLSTVVVVVRTIDAAIAARSDGGNREKTGVKATNRSTSPVMEGAFAVAS